MMLCDWIVLMSLACAGGNDNAEVETQEELEDSGVVMSEPSASFAYYTQGFEGEAVVVPGVLYEGIESAVRGINVQPDTDAVDEKLVWSLLGEPIDNPPECESCRFAFDITAFFDAEASIDPAGVGLDTKFSYALGQSDYGISLFYLSAQGWSPWITHGAHMTDFADISHWETVSFEGNRFNYSDRIVDFYYYY